MRHPWSRLLPLAALTLAVLAATGCPPPPTKYSAAEKDTRKAVSTAAIKGSEFNKLFPKPGPGEDVIFTQEKDGVAIAKLTKDGMDVATLSITDTISEPDAKDKFKDSTEKFFGFPLGAESKLETAMLVNDRIQIKVRSFGKANDPATHTLGEEDRKKWLMKFDLAGLSKLQ